MSHYKKSLSDSLLHSIITQQITNKEDIHKIVFDVEQFFRKPNTDSIKTYKNLEGKVSYLLRKWAKAIAQQETKKAENYNNQLENLTATHPFSWLKTKKLFLDHLVLPKDWKYLDWKFLNKKMNFSLIDYKLPDNAKLAIIGDWGTGSKDALFLLEELFNVCMPDAILHLGDIYFACTSFEVEKNFILPLENIFKKKGKRVPIFSIPGNHDYYSGGNSFYQLLETINKPLGDEYKQDASYFCLRTKSNTWQIIGGDTGINDKDSFKEIVPFPGLKPSEVEWIKDKLNFSGKTLFITHHPLVNDELIVNEDIKRFDNKLLEQLGPYLNKINLWLWGHQHKFTAYKKGFPIPSTNFVMPTCRLLGGSAREVSEIVTNYPEIIQKNKSGNIITTDYLNGLYNHSFAILDIGNNKINYYQVPAWNENNNTPIKVLPKNQKKCFFQEQLT